MYKNFEKHIQIRFIFLSVIMITKINYKFDYNNDNNNNNGANNTNTQSTKS